MHKTHPTIQTNLVAQNKHQSKESCFFEPIIPGIGQSKQQPNPKGSLFQFLYFLNNDSDQPNQQPISPQFLSSCPSVISPLIPLQINFSKSNSPEAKKQLSMSNFSFVLKQQNQTRISESSLQFKPSLTQILPQYYADKNRSLTATPSP